MYSPHLSAPPQTQRVLCTQASGLRNSTAGRGAACKRSILSWCTAAARSKATQQTSEQGVSSSSGGGGGGNANAVLEEVRASLSEADIKPKPDHLTAAAAAFDWREQWYPVAFLKDLPEGQLTRVELFDEQFVVVRRPQGGPVAMADRCPHRAAALSQGLLTPEGQIQCAYHGWKFDGTTGNCMNIPQLQPGASLSKATCGVAYPLQEYQGMLWLWPSTSALPEDNEPAGLPELDRDGWTSDDFVRDFPIDYSLLLENLTDPDHGLFAHQVSSFDSYTANAKHRMTVDTSVQNGRPIIASSVDSVNKMTAKPVNGKSRDRKPPGAGEETAEQPLRASIQFEAPSLVRWSRFDKEGNTNFIATFYGIPTGVGRSRLLLRYARNVAPWLHLPSWAYSMFMNNFLDQDSFLLASQQPITLQAELEGHLANQADKKAGSSNGSGSSSSSSSASTDQPQFPAQRRKLFCYKAPSDGLLIAIGRFIDAAVPRMPNRAALLLAAHSAGGMAGALPQPLREDVLDRWAHHTAICPDSMAAFNGFMRLRAVFLAVAAAGAASLMSIASAGGGVPRWGIAATAVAAVAAWLCHTAMRQFRYVYTRERQNKDLSKIPKITAHLPQPAQQPAAA